MSSEALSQERTADIATKQDTECGDVDSKSSSMQRDAEAAAAEPIQRNYRGYRERRQLQGLGLDPSTRWLEAVKEARYRNYTRPISRRKRSSLTPPTLDQARRNSDAARQNWKRIGYIARRAGEDDTSGESETEDITAEELEKRRQRKLELKREREKSAKMMDLQYFLEMVDLKHRHGANLRAYHEEWKKADTNENFFYWLDRGQGRHLELPTVSREKLDREQVRYLSREERLHYLVKIDEEGRLCWAENGFRISTDTEWKDSINGIVPKDDTTPMFRGSAASQLRRSTLSSSTSSSSSSSSYSAAGEEDGDHYVSNDLGKRKGKRRFMHASPAAILDHFLRKSVRPNSWIFVADTSFRLYVGIKQSGTFQHSSFLHGARISAAGLIKIKDGQLRKLSPLSGHYRPPTKNFRAFVRSLKDAGVDMSRVSVSRSYAVLIGLEGYKRARKKIKNGKQHLADHKQKLLHPDQVKKREEAEKDKSNSAEKEREALAAEAQQGEKTRTGDSFWLKMMKRLHLNSFSSESEGARDV